MTLFNHLLGTDQKSGADHRTLDQDLASVHGFRVNQIRSDPTLSSSVLLVYADQAWPTRYFVMDEKAIVGVVVPPHVDDNVDDESEDAGVLLIIRDDVGKCVAVSFCPSVSSRNDRTHAHCIT